MQDWRLYIVQEFADGGPLRKLYGNKAIWIGNGQVDLVCLLLLLVLPLVANCCV